MHSSQEDWQTVCREDCASALDVRKITGAHKMSAAITICALRFIQPPEKFGQSGYSRHAAVEMTTTPTAPCEPTREMALLSGGAHICACARGTLRDDAGALPINTTAATVARILVVRMGPGNQRELSPRTYAQSGEQVVTTYTGGQAKPLWRLYFSF